MKAFFIVLAMVCFVLSQASCGSKSTETTASVNATTTAAPPETPTVIEEVVPEETPESLTPEQVEARKLFERGNDLARKDRDAEAAQIYLQALDLDPDFAEAHLKLALTYIVLGKKKESEEEYKKAAEAYEKHVRRNPKDVKAFFNMGLAYSKLNKPEDAVKAFRQAAKLEPEDSDTQFELGLAYTKVARFQEAVLALQKANELDPNNYRAQEELEKARNKFERQQAILKQQEAIAKRQAPKSTNANTSKSTNTTTSPTPAPQLQ